MQKYKILRYLLVGLALLTIKCDCKNNNRQILDTDRDGVANIHDLCPNTRNGESVNEMGCSSAEINDHDRDGIPNKLDKCPRTPASLEKGVIVSDNGCLKNRVGSYDGEIIAKVIPDQIVLSVSNFTTEEINSIIEFLEIDSTAIKKCSCDKNIQLWPLPAGIELNNAITVAKSRSGKKLSGDKNFLFSIVSDSIVSEKSNYGGFPKVTFDPSLSDDPNKPIVAILDSGLDVKQLNFEGLQLLDTRMINQNINCDTPSGIVSGFGWNFSDGNADMSLDNWGHGTNVTKTFVKSLENVALSEFQVLPLKLFNETNSGEGSYWDIVCAFSYLNKLDSLGYNIALVNTSFGGQLESLRSNEGKTDKDLLVLKQLIDSLDETVVVSSAGNYQSDNDNIPHFPASYNSSKWFDSPSTNLIAVAGHNKSDPLKIFNGPTPTHPGSNYGMETVDLAAPWHFTILETGRDAFDRSIDGLELFGTSFSAPIVSARLLEYYIETGLKGEQLKVDFLNNPNKVQTNPNFNNFIKNSKYIIKNSKYIR